MRFPTAAWPPTQLATHPTGHPTLLPSSSAALASLASSAFRALTFQKLLFEVPSYRLHIKHTICVLILILILFLIG